MARWATSLPRLLLSHAFCVGAATPKRVLVPGVAGAGGGGGAATADILNRTGAWITVVMVDAAGDHGLLLEAAFGFKLVADLEGEAFDLIALPVCRTSLGSHYHRSSHAACEDGREGRWQDGKRDGDDMLLIS
uniref:Uncharacterized protein n=1 Tax=Oryza brachyantha TaxID=4533 RepID=J3MRQ2_ORYBR